jgi:spore maturation protein A
MNKIWLWIICFSLIYGIFTGRGAELSNVILNVPKEAFNLLITMITAACFWSGMMKIMESVGVVEFIAKRIRPLFKLIMPNLKDEQALNYVSMNIAANIFGLGYAATPSGLKAVKRMQELNVEDKSEATDEMVTFLVLNTAGVTLIPTSVMAIRAGLGAVNPADMLIYPIIATLLSCVSGLMADVYFRRKRYAKYN